MHQIPLNPMSWLPPLAGRLAFLGHRVCGHAVNWRSFSMGLDRAQCPGDIVCHDCRQVLWCRAHDPWRAARPEGVADHWGGTDTPGSAQLETFQRILHLADACPAGVSGDEIRQLATELIEAITLRQRTSCRRRMLTCLARLESLRLNGREGDDDPGEVAVHQLAVALTSLPS